MAEDEEFENWKFCHQINIKFHVKVEKSDSYRCLWCNRYESDGRQLQSDFSFKAAKCLAGHAPAITSEVGVCPECDVDLVQRIAERRVECSEPKCRRMVLVNQWKVWRRLGHSALTKKFLDLVNKHLTSTCPVCFDDVTLGEEDSGTATPRCQHDPTLCKDCLSYYVKDAIESGNWQSIKCPELKCEELLNGRDVRQFASNELFKTYDDHITRANLAKNPNFRWCFSKCGYGQIVNGVPNMPSLEETSSNSARTPMASQLTAAQWRCTKCNKLNCYRCKDEAHPSVTCEQEQHLKPQRGDNERERKKISKKCPKRGCGRYIGKTYGCVHMYCDPKTGGCGIKFCWKCKVIFRKKDSYNEYTSWEYKHLAKCPMIGGRYETTGTVPRPKKSNASYETDWDKDPLHKEGESGSEQWL